VGIPTPVSRKRTSRNAAAAFLEVRFRDTGVGIPPGDQRNLFIPFFTTKEKGTGLGLPISQRIIENHGGTIEVRSQPGEGATFTVLLPIEADAYAAHQEAAREAARAAEAARRPPPPPPTLPPPPPGRLPPPAPVPAPMSGSARRPTPPTIDRGKIPIP
ncbi:MAG TPA: ATP-binding protein, partial [Polyangia bacterium]|nr:ATP-binding protein [Polyangia bacterium]